MNYISISESKISIESMFELVRTSSSGGIASFFGTTRDRFEGTYDYFNHFDFSNIIILMKIKLSLS